MVIINNITEAEKDSTNPAQLTNSFVAVAVAVAGL